MKSITIYDVEYKYYISDEVNTTSFFVNEEVIEKKYFFFGEKVKRKYASYAFTINIDIESKFLSKEDVRKEIDEALRLHARELEIKRGEII